MLTPSLALTRTVIGILQGIFLYWLYHATEAKSWPATDPYAFAMMVTAGATVPLPPSMDSATCGRERSDSGWCSRHCWLVGSLAMASIATRI
jgi:hypothetical protein